MRWRLALALAYAILAAALSSSVLAPLQSSGSRFRLAFDARLVVIALVVVVAALMPFLQEGFKELFRQALERRRSSWRRVLLAAIFQVALLLAPLLLLMALTSRLPPTIPNNSTAAPVGQPAQQPFSEAGGAGEGGSEPSQAAPGQREASLEPAGGQWVPSGLFLPVAAVLLSVAAATAVYAAYEAWVEARSARRLEPGEAGEVEPELLEAARAAVRELEEGGDPRGAIVSYFLKLCRLLREREVDAGEEMTAREVARLALEKFKGLDPRPLMRLVQLFEEARYSDHAVDEAMREEALACFRAIADELARAA